jgi:hypothetical protein
VQYDDSDLSSDDEEVEMDVAEAKTDGTYIVLYIYYII